MPPLCDKCGFLHYRTDPCRVKKESLDAQKPKGRPNKTKPNLGRPRIHPNRKAYRAAWMKDWRARKKASAEGRDE